MKIVGVEGTHPNETKIVKEVTNLMKKDFPFFDVSHLSYRGRRKDVKKIIGEENPEASLDFHCAFSGPCGILPDLAFAVSDESLEKVCKDFLSIRKPLFGTLSMNIWGIQSILSKLDPKEEIMSSTRRECYESGAPYIAIELCAFREGYRGPNMHTFSIFFPEIERVEPDASPFRGYQQSIAGYLDDFTSYLIKI